MNEDLEQKFTNFLVDKINRTGGSLQFQYLFGCLPQELGFEVRNAFGKTKADVMKFLRGHPKLFKVDQKGVVTLVTSSAVEEDSHDSDESHKEEEQSKKKFPPKIENGEGIVEKISAKYAIIRAVRPIETDVYFTPHEYGAKSDSLFVHLNLEVGYRVLFNAVSGLDEYEIKYRATKVWPKPHENENAVPRNYAGERAIRKDSEYESQPPKALKEGRNDLSSSSEKNKKDPTPNENVIENERGKIYPFRNGAIIKFGYKYSEQADAKSSRFYLLGCEIFEMIDTEFSEGDNVMFDGIKTDGGWKAVLVWSGEKPNVKINTKVVNEIRSKVREDQGINSAPSSEKLPKASHENRNLPVQYREKRPVPLSQKKQSSYEKVETRSMRNNIVMKKNIPPDSPSTHNNRYRGNDRPESSEASRRRRRSRHRRSSHNRSKNSTHDNGSRKDNLCASRSKDNRQKTIPAYKRNSSCNFNDDGSYRFSSRETVPNVAFDSNQDSSDDDNKEIQASLHKRNRKFLQECGSPANESDYEQADSNGEENEMISSCLESNTNKCASIKKFCEIQGTIVRLYCKFAIVSGPQVPEGVDFVLSAFFLDGKSVEEQNVIDLKEVIKVGDSIRFNYFQIVDDKGEVYFKVTAAWIGPRPEIEETTPEEYIREFDLSVSVNAELDDECREEEVVQEHSNTGSIQSENTPEFFSSSNSLVVDDMSEEMNDPVEYSSDSKAENNEEDSDDSSSDIDSPSLSEKIIERLKNNGCVPLNPKVDIHFIVEDIINTVLNESNVQSSENATPNQARTRLGNNFQQTSELQCPTCAKQSNKCKNKMTSSVKVQTIITGEVIAAKRDDHCQILIQKISKKK